MIPGLGLIEQVSLQLTRFGPRDASTHSNSLVQHGGICAADSFRWTICGIDYTSWFIEFQRFDSFEGPNRVNSGEACSTAHFLFHSLLFRPLLVFVCVLLFPSTSFRHDQCLCEVGPSIRTYLNLVDRLREGCRESTRCSRDTYPESYITKYTIIRRTYLIHRYGFQPPSRPNILSKEHQQLLRAASEQRGNNLRG